MFGIGAFLFPGFWAPVPSGASGDGGNGGDIEDLLVAEAVDLFQHPDLAGCLTAGVAAVALALLWLAMPETLAKPSFVGDATVA